MNSSAENGKFLNANLKSEYENFQPVYSILGEWTYSDAGDILYHVIVKPLKLKYFNGLFIDSEFFSVR